MTDAFFAGTITADVFECPPFDLIDACFEGLSSYFETELANCALSDAISGEVCLTPEKYAKLITRALGRLSEVFGNVCSDALIHREVTEYTKLAEVAGCAEFVDQFAEGPYSSLGVFGLSPSAVASFQSAFAPFPAPGPDYYSFIGPYNLTPVNNPIPNPVPVPVPVPNFVPVPVGEGESEASRVFNPNWGV